jgi:hypothetical protein
VLQCALKAGLKVESIEGCGKTVGGGGVLLRCRGGGGRWKEGLPCGPGVLVKEGRGGRSGPSGRWVEGRGDGPREKKRVELGLRPEEKVGRRREAGQWAEREGWGKRFREVLFVFSKLLF